LDRADAAGRAGRGRRRRQRDERSRARGADPRLLVEIRPARAADAAAIAEVHVRTWRHAYRDLLPRELLDALTVERRTEMWRGVLEQESGKVWVAEAQAGLRGFASAGPSLTEEDVAELYAIYV